MEKPVIKASWFGSHDYCEYKWYLENVLKEEAPILKTMIVGKEIHQIKEYEFRKIASPATMKEFLDSKKYTITKEISLRKEFSEFILVGRLDELAVDENYIYVIDDKPKAKLWLGNKRQIWAYCILVKDLIKNKYPQHALVLVTHIKKPNRIPKPLELIIHIFSRPPYLYYGYSLCDDDHN